MAVHFIEFGDAFLVSDKSEPVPVFQPGFAGWNNDPAIPVDHCNQRPVRDIKLFDLLVDYSAGADGIDIEQIQTFFQLVRFTSHKN